MPTETSYTKDTNGRSPIRPSKASPETTMGAATLIKRSSWLTRKKSPTTKNDNVSALPPQEDIRNAGKNISGDDECAQTVKSILESRKPDTDTLRNFAGHESEMEYGMTALHFAASSRKDKTSLYLIQEGWDPFYCEKATKKTPLWHIVDNARIDVLEEIVKRDSISSNRKNRKKNAKCREAILDAAFHAATKDDVQCLKLIVEGYGLKASDTAQTDHNVTLLHVACSGVGRGETEYFTPIKTAPYLLKQKTKAPCMKTEPYGCTPLHVAALLSFDKELIKLLIDAASPDSKTIAVLAKDHQWCGNTAVHILRKRLYGSSHTSTAKRRCCVPEGQPQEHSRGSIKENGIEELGKVVDERYFRSLLSSETPALKRILQDKHKKVLDQNKEQAAEVAQDILKILETKAQGSGSYIKKAIIASLTGRVVQASHIVSSSLCAEVVSHENQKRKLLKFQDEGYNGSSSSHPTSSSRTTTTSTETTSAIEASRTLENRK